MALVPANITLNWISNYPGQHRVCFRIQGSGNPYVCTTNLTPHPNCPGGGAPCSYNLSIQVDNETCDTITYEGYVQPTCQTEDSMVGRTPFTVSFIPEPSCKRWELECTSVPIASITITNAGSGYDSVIVPSVTITGGGGSGATATAEVDGVTGMITAINIVNPGSGYTSVPTVTIPAPSSGTQATATAVLGTCVGQFGIDCPNTVTSIQYPALDLGETIALCKDTAPTPPASYTVTEDGNCLCGCESSRITAVGGTVNIKWMDCGKGDMGNSTLTAGQTLTICAPASSVVITDGTGTHTVTSLGACDGV